MTSFAPIRRRLSRSRTTCTGLDGKLYSPAGSEGRTYECEPQQRHRLMYCHPFPPVEHPIGRSTHNFAGKGRRNGDRDGKKATSPTRSGVWIGQAAGTRHIGGVTMKPGVANTLIYGIEARLKEINSL